ncbi:MAG: hypothetical protein LBH86_02005 [Oscillospiraceae bacterium]|jgi:hypothetical protein|nr:hypothetical protein [Oscillospiraceae bacterium]
MRKILAGLLAAALVLSLTACNGIKGAVQEKTRELLGGAAGQPAPADGTKAGGSPGGSGAAPAGGKRPIANAANPGGYWDRLEAEWGNAPEEGYVWTITIDSAETLDIMGLGSVTYNLDLSCSHVGKTMRGVYRGEMAMDYAADLSGMVELLTLTGGSIDYDADGWFKNGNFIMELDGYDDYASEAFVESFQQTNDMSAEEQAIADAYLGQFLSDMGTPEKDFEQADTPAGQWFDWEFHMTEGDMSGYINMTGIAYGTTGGSGSVDAGGTYMEGYATASAPLVGTFSERYSDTIDKPFPYLINVYDNDQVVFVLHSANGGPVQVRFYGTIDKIPVEETTLLRP